MTLVERRSDLNASVDSLNSKISGIDVNVIIFNTPAKKSAYDF